MSISVVILTYNSELTISKTLESAKLVSDDIHVVDSFSEDNTLSILQSHNIKFVQHSFEDYGSQRNWSIQNLNFKYSWQLHLDADEYLSENLIVEINSLDLKNNNDLSGYFIPRLVCFMGRKIIHGGMYPIMHMRLFKKDKGKCESRNYDQHFFVDGDTKCLRNPMVDDIRMSLFEWTNRHNRWSESELKEYLKSDKLIEIEATLSGTPVQKKRFFRGVYESQPLFYRSFLLFVYRYFLQLGFLDGKEGLIFFVLQAFWFRFLIDAKIYENGLKSN